MLPHGKPPDHQRYIAYMDAMREVNLTMSNDGLANLRKRVMKALEKDIPVRKYSGYLLVGYYEDYDFVRSGI